MTDRNAFHNLVGNYSPLDEIEQKDTQAFTEFTKVFGDKAYSRENMIGHITASCWIYNQQRSKVLMVHHNLYQSWSWIGGHADGKKNLLAVALNEALEETGISNLILITTSPIEINVLPVQSHYKNNVYIPAHLHFNVVFGFIGDENRALKIKPDENSDVGWLDVKNLEQFCTEPHMLPIYRRIIEKIKKIG